MLVLKASGAVIVARKVSALVVGFGMHTPLQSWRTRSAARSRGSREASGAKL